MPRLLLVLFLLDGAFCATCAGLGYYHWRMEQPTPPWWWTGYKHNGFNRGTSQFAWDEYHLIHPKGYDEVSDELIRVYYLTTTPWAQASQDIGSYDSGDFLRYGWVHDKLLVRAVWGPCKAAHPPLRSDPWETEPDDKGCVHTRWAPLTPLNLDSSDNGRVDWRSYERQPSALWKARRYGGDLMSLVEEDRR